MIHAYALLGRYIVLDVHSGAVHELDRAAFDALRDLDKEFYEHPELLSAIREGHGNENCDIPKDTPRSELCRLIEDGLLFSQKEHITGREADLPLKALCLHVSHDCNMRCGYCFAHTGDFGTGRRVTMTSEVAERAIDYLLARCGGRRNLEIDFFGGEPLMALDTVKHTVEYAKKVAPEKNFRFTLTTNGVLLDDKVIDYLNCEMSNVVLSLDGRREVNDRMRKCLGGGGSYDEIVPKYKHVIETRAGDYYVRGTYTRNNMDFVSDVEHLAALGFRNISVEPAVLKPGHPLALTEDDLPALCAEYEKLCEVMSNGVDFSFFHFNVDLEQGPCVYKRLRGCGAGIEYAAITPDGDVYPCHQFVGRDGYLMGNVCGVSPLPSSDSNFVKEQMAYPLSDTFNEVSSQFKVLDAQNREECKNCWAQYFCGGGCAAGNLTVNGDIRLPDRLGCELSKKRLECAIYLKTLDLTD